jgi:hypothetical protein
MDAALSPPVRCTGLDAGTIWDKTPAEMTSVEHFLSDYSVVDATVSAPDLSDPALSAPDLSAPALPDLVPAAPGPRSRPWGTA